MIELFPFSYDSATSSGEVELGRKDPVLSFFSSSFFFFLPFLGVFFVFFLGFCGVFFITGDGSAGNGLFFFNTLSN